MWLWSVAVGENTACGGFYDRSAWTLTPEHTGDTMGELLTHYHDSWKENLGHESCGKIHNPLAEPLQGNYCNSSLTGILGIRRRKPQPTKHYCPKITEVTSP